MECFGERVSATVRVKFSIPEYAYNALFKLVQNPRKRPKDPPISRYCTNGPGSLPHVIIRDFRSHNLAVSQEGIGDTYHDVNTNYKHYFHNGKPELECPVDSNEEQTSSQHEASKNCNADRIVNSQPELHKYRSGNYLGRNRDQMCVHLVPSVGKRKSRVDKFSACRTMPPLRGTRAPISPTARTTLNRAPPTME